MIAGLGSVRRSLWTLSPASDSTISALPSMTRRRARRTGTMVSGSKEAFNARQRTRFSAAIERWTHESRLACPVSGRARRERADCFGWSDAAGPRIVMRKLPGGHTGSLLHQPLDPTPDRFSHPLTPGDHQHGIVARDRPDDFRPSCLVERFGDRAGGPARRLEHQQRADPVHA